MTVIPRGIQKFLIYIEYLLNIYLLYDKTVRTTRKDRNPEDRETLM